MQAFDQNLKCSLDIDSTATASQSTQLSRNDAPVQSCQGNELDVYVPSTKPDGFMHAQGFTADLLTATPLVSPNSLAFDAQGNWPVAYQTGLGTDGKEFFGGVLDVNSRRGPADTVGSTTEIMEAMQGSDYSTDVRSNMRGLRVTQYADTIGQGGVAGIHYPADNSLHIGLWSGGSQYGEDGTTIGQYGTYGGDLVFNPGYMKGGVALCGSLNGYTNSASSCLSMQSGGQVSITPNQTSTGVSFNVDPSGYSGGSAGSAALAVGSVPSTSATAIGVYLASTYGNSLEEIEVGGNVRRTLDASGNEVISGGLTTSGNVSVKSGNSVLLYSSDNTQDGYFYVGSDNIEHHSNSVSATGLVSTGNVAVGSGGSLLLPASNTIVQPFLYASLPTSTSSNPTVYLHNSAGSAQNLETSGSLASGTWMQTASYKLASVPTTATDGAEIWCSDCTLNGVAGVEAHWHSSESKWLDSQNNTLAN